MDGGLLSLGYTYDAVGNVQTLTDNLGGRRETYSYDHRDRLTGWVSTATATNQQLLSETYGYDAIGNLTNKAGVGYTYNASGAGSVRPHAVAAVGAGGYGYDADGNLTGGGGRALTWDGLNQLVGVVGPDGVAEQYLADADGRRVQQGRAIGQAGGYYTLHWAPDLEEEYGRLWRATYRLGDRVVAQREWSAAAGFALRWLHAGGLGSVYATSGASGVLLGWRHYTPWGAYRDGGGVVGTPLDFTGQRKDGTGLLDYGTRAYDPALGRFVSADTIAPKKDDPQSRNRYSYVLNNPLKYTDPTGQCSLDPAEQDSDENQSCNVSIDLLRRYGVVVHDFANWTAWELVQVYHALATMAQRLGWQAPGKFAEIMGETHVHRVLTQDTRNFCGLAGPACAQGASLWFANSAFYDGNGNAHQGDYIQRTVVHEYAHVWDGRTGGNASGFLPKATNGDLDGAPSDYARRSPWSEDFAESVAYYVFPDEAEGSFRNSARWQYVACLAYYYAHSITDSHRDITGGCASGVQQT